MYRLALVSLLALAHAQAPIWWAGGECGMSKYADAGDACPVGATCANVIGGTTARDNEFPWMVSLRTADGHKCGGMLLNEEWVLSAAACTAGVDPADVQIYVGSGSLSTPLPTEMMYSAAAVFEHENYNGGTYDNDLTLLKLTVNATFSADVTAICAPDPTMLYDALELEASGWGYPVSGGPLSDTLEYTSLMTMVNADCQAIFTGNTITDDMICAGDGGTYNSRDTCEGDAGGPLGLKDGTTGKYTAVGITSWGIGCSSGFPGVYTRISQFNQWITDKMNKN